jgi:hypothetical protein
MRNTNILKQRPAFDIGAAAQCAGSESGAANKEMTLTEKAISVRDRLSGLIPQLRCIQEGLYGAGKFALEGSSIKASAPPQSIEQVIEDTGMSLNEVAELIDQLWRKV